MHQGPQQQGMSSTTKLKIVFGIFTAICAIAHLIINQNAKNNSPEYVLLFWRLTGILSGIGLAGYGITEVYEARPENNDDNQAAPANRATLTALPPQLPDYSQSVSLSTALSTSLSASSQTVSSNALPPTTLRSRTTGVDKPANANNDDEQECIRND